MLTKTHNLNSTTLAAAMLAAALVFTVNSGASAQSRGTFDNVGDGTMGFTATNNGRVLPVVGNDAAGGGVAQRQLPANAANSYAATQRSMKPRRRQK